MSLEHEKPHPSFGAKLLNVDLRAVKPKVSRKLLDLMNEHAVCAVPHKVSLTNEQKINFSKMLEPVERSAKKNSWDQ